MQPTIKTRWVKNMQFVSTDSDGHSIVMDSPVLGENSGVRPVELVLTALAGCTGMDVISILQKKRQRVVDFEVNISGERREDHPKAWTRMHTEFLVRGHDIDPVAVERAIELSETKYCSVTATLQGNVEMTHSVVIEEIE
jgi:putative redox protein